MTLPANVTNYTDAGAQPARTYCYRLSAHSAWRQSGYASLVINTTPAVDSGSFSLCFQIDRAARRVLLSWPNTTGKVYRVVYKSNLGDPAWTDLSSDLTASGPMAFWSEPIADGVPMRLFGVRVVR